MLKIVSNDAASSSVVLKLEGKVIGPWVEEVRRISEKIFTSGRTLTFDLSEVTYVDREGVQLFRALRDQQARFLNCSGFVAELLRS
jgi:anti-anti-sigma regulatory factor